MEYYGFVVGEEEPGVTHSETYKHMLDLAAVAEEGGMNGWFFAEHHGDGYLSTTPSPNLLIAAASQTTSTLRLGVMVSVLPYHHPLRAAEEIRMLDQLTNGRLEVGLGRGAIRHEQQAYGVERQTTSEQFDASLDVLLELLTTDSATFSSQWWSGSIEKMTPAAVQRPHPPLWAAAVSPNSITRAARTGSHAATTLLPLDLAVVYRSEYHEAWNAVRPDEPVGKFSHGVTIAIAETSKEAEQNARELLEARSAHFLKQISDRPKTGDKAYAHHERGWRDYVDSSFTQLVDRGCLIFGSVDDAIEQTSRIVESGIEMLTVVPQFSGLDYAAGRRSLELFANEVIPKADPNRVAPSAMTESA